MDQRLKTMRERVAVGTATPLAKHSAAAG